MATLYLFAISHFCEKARWALDFLEVEHELAFLGPGQHAQFALDHGLAATSLPVVDTGDGLVQGSGAIIDWADGVTRSGRTLTPPELRSECIAIEQRLDDIVGVHSRRGFYSEALFEFPADVMQTFTRDLSPPEGEKVAGAWDAIREMMIQGMDLGPEQGEESQRLVAGELDWLDGLFSDGRRYLVGDTFTRADLTLSALLSRIAEAPERPSTGSLELPHRLRAVAAEWRTRPTFSRILENYRDHRGR